MARDKGSALQLALFVFEIASEDVIDLNSGYMRTLQKLSVGTSIWIEQTFCI